MVNIHTLNRGDKVKIIDKWCIGCCQNINGLMDRYLGSIMTVKNVEFAHVEFYEDAADRDGRGWQWVPATIECVVCDDKEDVDSYEDTMQSIHDFMKKFTVR